MDDRRRMVRLFDPTALPSHDDRPIAPRLPNLQNKRIGILDNTKPNADVLMTHIAAALQQHHGVADVMHRRKAHAAIGALETLLDDLANRCDAALVGSGD